MEMRRKRCALEPGFLDVGLRVTADAFYLIHP
jgi:hypothetical protein